MMTALVVTGLHAYLNVRSLHCLSILNQWNVFWSIAGLTIIIAVLSIFAPHQNSMWVFTHYENGTGFDNTFYVFILAMIGPAYSLFGKDAERSTKIFFLILLLYLIFKAASVPHRSMKRHKMPIFLLPCMKKKTLAHLIWIMLTIPYRAIVGSIATAWAVGLVFLIVLLFSIQNMDSILNTSFDMPVAQLFQVPSNFLSFYT